jgi:hypothetical protein
MFTPDSRYVSQPTYTIQLPDGRHVSAVVVPAPTQPAIIGYSQTPRGERLDLIAVQYLNSPTGFWRLCDANNALLAGALSARPRIAIPRGGRS